MDNKKTFKEAFKTMTPLILGFIPTAIAFALLARAAGIERYQIILSSLIVFAGSVQFVTTELVRQGTGYLQFAVIVFLLHSRHLFYGISVFDKFNKTGKLKPFMIFALTDETYAIFTGTKLPAGVTEGLYYFLISLMTYIVWNIGTLMGVFASSIITFNTTGMDFAFTALFVVILLEQFMAASNKLPFFIGAASAAISLVIIGPQSMLLGCAVLSVISLIAGRKYIERAEVKTDEHS